MINLKFLGASGGIGGNERKTTCYMINETILIDAGTGLTSLSLSELNKIDNIVLTHAHWDHIACLPLILDSVFSLRTKPINLWGIEGVLNIVRTHIFNDFLWPDFTKIDSPFLNRPVIELKKIDSKKSFNIQDIEFSLLKAKHGVPACGYRLFHNDFSIAFSGDTEDSPEFWNALKKDVYLKAVILECSYPEKMNDLANLTQHLSVKTVRKRLSELHEKVQSFVIHLKPGLEEQIIRELTIPPFREKIIFPKQGDVFDISN